VIRVLITASSELMCAGLEAVLSTHSGLVIVGRWQDIAGLAPLVEAQQPDIVLLELESTDDDTLAILEALAAAPHPQLWSSSPMTRRGRGRRRLYALAFRRSCRARQWRARSWRPSKPQQWDWWRSIAIRSSLYCPCCRPPRGNCPLPRSKP
jgi:hypothetical protein